MNVSKSPVQQCPICRAQQPLEATRCDTCGAALNGIPISGAVHTVSRRKERTKPLGGPVTGDWDEGETDLYEGALPSMPLQGLLVIVVALAVVGGVAFFVATQVMGATPAQSTRTPTQSVAGRATEVPTAGSPPPQNTLPPTNTKIAIIPTLALATVTPAPPTATITPTQGPCVQKAKKGDTLYGMAARCGHKDLAVVDLILEMNNMTDANKLQEGQTIIIPWPTPTGAPQSGDGSETQSASSANAEPTLPPGVMWYTVKKGETAILVAYNHKTDMKTLRDLNPEIQFLQCDFGIPSGGPECRLNPILGEGQRIRVPAPTPTASPPPTLTGSETATPTPTATFNAPFSQAPSDNMLFESAELPTLRWVASGQLAQNEVYLVTVRNTTTGTVYTATTRELSFQIPADWQPADGKRHVFEWSVAVAQTGEGGTPTPTAYTTETRKFTWQGR